MRNVALQAGGFFVGAKEKGRQRTEGETTSGASTGVTTWSRQKGNLR
jgi:hypothetical protein